MVGVGVSAYLSLTGRRRGGRLFEAGYFLTFSAYRMGAYSTWALIRGWALIQINTVYENESPVSEKVKIASFAIISCKITAF